MEGESSLYHSMNSYRSLVYKSSNCVPETRYSTIAVPPITTSVLRLPFICLNICVYVYKMMVLCWAVLPGADNKEKTWSTFKEKLKNFERIWRRVDRYAC